MVVIKSLGEEVLNKLSYEERIFLEESIRGFSDKAKLRVEEILSKISDEERVARIKKAIARINETNRIRKEKNLKGIVGLTPLSFLSHAEMKSLCGVREPTEKERREMELYPKTRIAKFALPSSLDWRDGNWMTPVKNQSLPTSCGSCWAFGALGAIEAKEKIMQNNPNLNIDLSEQDLVSCSDAGTCNGGMPFPSYEYVRDNGVVYEDCFSYFGCNEWEPVFDNQGNIINYVCIDENLCNLCSDWENRLYTINTFEDFSYQDLKSALNSHGPITFCMQVRTDFFDVRDEIYVPDPISETNRYEGGHAMIIVGYDDTEQYWIIKNSWGTSPWGDSGYCRISYDAHDEIFLDQFLYLAEGTLIGEPVEPKVQVTINYTTIAKNIKNPHDIIIGFSIYSGTPTDETWVADLPWWVVIDPTDNMEYTVPYSYSLGLAEGDYTLRARAWRDYDLVGATEIDRITTDDGKTIIVYSGGSLYSMLDEMDATFVISPPEIVSADINNISFSFG